MLWSYLHVEITQKIFMAGKFIVELGQGHMYYQLLVDLRVFSLQPTHSCLFNPHSGQKDFHIPGFLLCCA